MIFATDIQRTRWLIVGCLLIAASSGTRLTAQEAEDPKPELFTREYPDVKEFHTSTFRPTPLHRIDKVAELPDWQPITTGKSDGQLVDEIELLRSSGLEPKFVSIGTAALAGTPIVAADLSADGKTLVTYDSERRLTTWSLPDGEKLVEFPLEDPSSQAAVAISSDGTQLLFGDSSTNVLLLDAKTGEVQFTHDRMEFPIGAVEFSPTATYIAAADIKGNAYIAKPKAAGTLRKGESFTDIRPLVDVAVGDNGTHAWVVASSQSVYFSTKIGYSHGSVTRDPFPAAATDANDRQLLLVDQGNVAVMYKDPATNNYTGKNAKALLPCFGARFDSQNQTAWLTTEGGIDVRVVNYLPIFDVVRYPQTDAKTDLVLTAPDADLLVLISEEGEAGLWRLEDNQARLHAEMLHNVHALIEEHRFDAIELLAKRWANVEFDLYDSSQETMLNLLTSIVRTYRTSHGKQKNARSRFKQYVIENPDCEFFRIVLTVEAIKTAWDCRGRGFAGGVDEQEYKYFKLNLKQATNMLMPLFQRDEPPCPEAYVQALAIAKGDQWNDDEIAYLMSEARANAPAYPRIYGEAAVSLMPRWGGGPASSVRMARTVCDAVGGDEGDALYANVAWWVHNYHGWDDTFDLLGFSQYRVMQGYAKMAMRDKTRQNINLSQALRMAHQLDDRQTAKEVAEYFESIEAVPVLYLWPEGLPHFEQVMTWALDRPYEFARIEAKVPQVTPEDFAPTPHELAKVEELDQLAHASNKAAFVQEKSFSLGDQRPREVELDSDAKRLVTIGRDGNLQVWDVATGEPILKLTGEDAPGKGVVAVSHRGKVMVIGTEDGKLELRDTESGKILFQAVDFAPPMVKVGMSTHADEFYGVDGKNRVIIVRDGEKKTWQPEVLNPKEETLMEPPAVAIDVMGTYLQGLRFKDRVQVWILAPNKEGNVAGQKVTIDTSLPVQIISGSFKFAVLVKDSLVKIGSIDPRDASFDASSHRLLQEARRAKFTSHGRQLWYSTDRCIDLRNWDGMQHDRPVKLPAEIDSSEWIRLAPDAGKFVHVDGNGNAAFWKLEGNRLSNEYRLVEEIVQLMNEGHYKPFELLGERWAQQNTPGFSSKSDNLYQWLVQHLVQIPLRSGEVEVYQEKLRQYLTSHPEAALMRLALFELTFEAAWKARGDQPDDATPADVLRAYEDQLQQCKEILTPLMQRDDTPPEAFAAAIRLGRELDWSRSQMKAILERAANHAPRYAPPYAEACRSLLPKHGGQAEEAERYASMAADRAGGEDGDIIYGHIALELSESETWPVVLDELKFSRDRVLRGLVALAGKHPHPHLVRTAMTLAHEGKKKEAAAAVAEIMQGSGYVPYDFHWEKDGASFEEVMQWATSD